MCGPSLKREILFKTDMCAARDKRRKGNITTWLGSQLQIQGYIRTTDTVFENMCVVLGRYSMGVRDNNLRATMYIIEYTFVDSVRASKDSVGSWDLHSRD